MKLLALSLVGFAISSPAMAGQDYPHRDWGKLATLDMSLSDATACIAREMDRQGSVLVLPVDGGNDIDFSADSMFGTVGEPWERFKLRTESGVTTLRIFYRHPINRRWIEHKDMPRLMKGCLKVEEVAPAQTQTEESKGSPR